tara:strand:+ start:207 stop:1100 length:894 start_codon:yes stop_codon:yes gene_type:complete
MSDNHRIRLFADTADLDEIAYCFSRGVNDGITTNPKIMESTGDLSRGFMKACRGITSKYADAPVSLETDLQDVKLINIHKLPANVMDSLFEQGKELRELGENVVVKIPICMGGLAATSLLAEQGIKTNVTACMTPYQALQAAEAGATYVSLFSNRMVDGHILDLAGFGENTIARNPSGWKDLVAQNKEEFLDHAWNRTLIQIGYVARELHNTGSSLIIGSIRTPKDIYKIASAGPQVITIPTKIVRGLEDIEDIKQTVRSIYRDCSDKLIGNSLEHPMSDYTIAEFEEAAESYRVEV